MQCGIGDRYTPNKYWRKLGDWCQLARTANLHINGKYCGELLLCRIFVSHRPARFARDKAKLPLQREAVDFVNHSVDVVRQGIALLAHRLMKRY